MQKTLLNPSPLTVIAQEFSEVCITANPEKEHGPGGIEVEREVALDEDNPNRWTIDLIIGLTVQSGKIHPPYFGSIWMQGLYEVHENYPGDPERLIRVTGASMLYGAAREMIANLTARGPNGMLTLPSVSFIEPVSKKAPAKKVAKKRVKAK